MEKIVNSIQNLSSTEADLKQLKSQLTKDESTIAKNLPILDEVLNVLDPAAHSLGYLFVLSAKANAAKIEAQKFVNQVSRFFKTCNGAQIRLTPSKFAQVARKFTEIVIEGGQPLRAVKPLVLAIRKVRPNSESLTPIHADLTQVCLLSKCYNAALSILDEEIFEVSTEQTNVSPRDMLLYYYYGGMIYTGLKEYRKALAFFKTVVTAPAIVLSAIMVEAYKKLILLSLLVHGRTPNLPRYTSSVVQRHHKTTFPHYQEFATVYATNNTDDLHKVAAANAEAFQKDKNFGLVKQCIQSLYRRNIQKCTQTYITFSLQDIAASVKLTSVVEAEKHILRMIEQGEIFATINQKDGMVSFQEDPEQYDTTSILNHLDQNIQKVIALGNKVRLADEGVASSASYLQRIVSGSGRSSEFEELAEMPEKSTASVPGKIV